MSCFSLLTTTTSPLTKYLSLCPPHAHSEFTCLPFFYETSPATHADPPSSHARRYRQFIPSSSSVQTFQRKKNFVMIGHYRHAPNVDSIHVSSPPPLSLSLSHLLISGCVNCGRAFETGWAQWEKRDLSSTSTVAVLSCPFIAACNLQPVSLPGANPVAELTALTKPDIGFFVRGALSESELYSRLSKYRVHLAPLRFGAVSLPPPLIPSLTMACRE